jgi:hypothetical protein
MTRARRQFLAILTVLALAVGCESREDGRRSEPPATSPTAAAGSLDERLLESLARRRQWPANSVKVWLSNPTVATQITQVTSSGRRSVLVHAWGGNENDYNTPMIRLDRGDVLYAVTNAELDELRARAAVDSRP